MTDTYEIDPPMDALMVVVAELMRIGVFQPQNVASMVRRLKLSDLPDIADRIEQLHFSNEVDTPSKNRSAIHLVSDNSDGGKEPEGV